MTAIKRAMLLRLILSASVLLLTPACGEVGLFFPRPADDGGGGGEVSDWVTVRNQTQCAGLNDRDCLGFFGFSVTNDGRFEVGPNAAGETIDGQLTSAELLELSNAVDALLGAGTGLQCSEIAVSPGVFERIVAVGPGGNEAVLFEEIVGGESACFRGTEASALALEQIFMTLMTRYYPSDFGQRAAGEVEDQPFPDNEAPPGGPF